MTIPTYTDYNSKPKDTEYTSSPEHGDRKFYDEDIEGCILAEDRIELLIKYDVSAILINREDVKMFAYHFGLISEGDAQ